MMNTEPMRSKVFKNKEVLILERDINAWLVDNSDIEVVDTAVADNQFIILYNKCKTSKIDKDIEVAKDIKGGIKELSSNGFHAPYITDYNIKS